MEGQNPQLGMSPKDRFDAAMALMGFRAQRITDRRQYEWKITLGLWGLLAASPLYVRPRPPDWILAGMLALLVALFTWRFLRPMMQAHRADTEDMFRRYEQAEKIAGLEIAQPRTEGLGRWWGWFQILATAFLAVTAFYLIGRIPGRG
jgi:hypothetical protein